MAEIGKVRRKQASESFWNIFFIRRLLSAKEWGRVDGVDVSMFPQRAYGSESVGDLDNMVEDIW